MMRTPGFVFTCIMLILMSIMQACSYRADFNSMENRKEIALIVKMKGGDYWNTVKMGAEAAAREFGVNISYAAPDAEDDFEKQIILVNEALKRGTDAIILAPNDAEKLVQVTEEAYGMKIPVIIIDSEVNTKKINSFIATDNVDLGKKAGMQLVQIAGENCHAAILSFIKGAGNAKHREKGLFSVTSEYPGITIPVKEYCLSDSSHAFEVTRKILTERIEINAIVALNTESSIGAAEAVQKMGMAGKVKLITFDNTPEGIEFLEDGVIQSMIIQNPFSIGYLGVKYAVDAMNGKRIPARVDTGSKAIDKSNMYTIENQKLLFPFVK